MSAERQLKVFHIAYVIEIKNTSISIYIFLIYKWRNPESSSLTQIKTIESIPNIITFAG